MRKIISITLMLLCVISLLVSCGAKPTHTITLADGTIKKMTTKEIYNFSQKSEREYESTLNGSEIYGTGTIESIIGPQLYSYGWQSTIYLKDGMVIDYICDDGEFDLYSGDEIVFSGHLASAFSISAAEFVEVNSRIFDDSYINVIKE